MQPNYHMPPGLTRDASGIESPLTCFLVRGALAPGECARRIAEIDPCFSATGRDYPPGYRDNDRLVLDDGDLAAALYRRLAPLLPARLVDEHGDTWRLVGLNERFRFCRYRDGQRFCIHRDGAHARDPQERSRLTVMLYLNGADRFVGGSTRFYASRTGERPIGAVHPEAGMAVVFDHDLWHDGEAVTAGSKVVMRTDVMYRRDAGARAAPADELRGHSGYVFAVLARKGGTLATASRDRTVRVWARTAGGFAERARLVGHEASVLALAEPGGALVSGSRDRTVRIWDRSGGRVAGTHEGAVLCLAALPDGRFASGGADGAIGLFSPAGERLATLRGHDGWVWALAATGDGRLASASEDGTLRLWDLASGQALATARVGSAARALVATGGALACGDLDGAVTIFRDLRPTNRVAIHSAAVTALAALPGGCLASAGEDDAVRIWRDGRLEATHHHRGFVRCLAALADGTVASGGYDEVVRFFRPTLQWRA
jgi:hypothetical protein